MLRFLLDEHLPRVLAEQVRALRPEIEVLALAEWDGGAHLGDPDPKLLTAAAEGGWTLVSYDLRTLPPLLKEWAEGGISHAGVILINRRTLAANDVGGLLRALLRIWDELGTADWVDRVLYVSSHSP